MQPGPSRLRQWIDRRIDPAIDLPPGSRVQRDLAYGDDPAQRLDVYAPAATATSGALLIVLVHGGAWAIGDKAAPRVVAHKAKHWLALGHTLVSINYRLLPQADPLAQADDLARALGFIQASASIWDVDVAKLVLLGHSTGAHLAALLAADAALARSYGARPWHGTILIDSAALDVVRTMRGPHLPLHDRAFGNDPAYWHRASPLHRLTQRPAAPLLLVHSEARPESASQAQRFADAVLALGGRAEVLGFDLTHAELNAELGRDPAYTAQVDAFVSSLGAA